MSTKKLNILFLTVSKVDELEGRGIYKDLLRYFRNQGHSISIVYPVERRSREKAKVETMNGVNFIGVKTPNIVKANTVEKAISTLLIGPLYKRAIKRHLPDRFDLILYPTPPITFVEAVKYVKKRDNAKTYLLLKDIFPQNAVDLGMFSKSSPIYKYFRAKEKEFYRVSDHIGCMSPANVDYVLKHNPEISPSKVEVCPNSIEVIENAISDKERVEIRERYNVPKDATVFVYGGNLGQPQGLDFLMKTLLSNKEKSDRFFLIVGNGTRYSEIEGYIKDNNINNAALFDRLPKEEYDSLIKACDVGLIFLDPRFTIPNFPSRLLSYLENRMPVIAATDSNTDIGTIAEKNNFGLSLLNGDLDKINDTLNYFIDNPEKITELGENGFEYLNVNYDVRDSYTIIIKSAGI